LVFYEAKPGKHPGIYKNHPTKRFELKTQFPFGSRMDINKFAFKFKQYFQKDLKFRIFFEGWNYSDYSKPTGLWYKLLHICSVNSTSKLSVDQIE